MHPSIFVSVLRKMVHSFLPPIMEVFFVGDRIPIQPKYWHGRMGPLSA